MSKYFFEEQMMVEKRSFVKALALCIVTLGIYMYFWIYKLAKDVNAICEGDGKTTAGLAKLILLGIVTFGIYIFIWLFRLGDRMQDIGPKYNVDIKEGGSTILLWYLLGASVIVGPFVAFYIIIKNVNALAEEYNKKPAA